MALSKNDLQQIKELINDSLQANNTVLLNSIFKYVDQRLDQTEENFSKQISHLPTKSEFYESQDKLMNELKTHREERKVNNHRLTRLESFHQAEL